MELVQSRIVTDDVEGLAAFDARLAGTPVALDEHYIEVPAGANGGRLLQEPATRRPWPTFRPT